MMQQLSANLDMAQLIFALNMHNLQLMAIRGDNFRMMAKL